MWKKVYFIWIWWIWISAVARYYKENWFNVFGSDKYNSELIDDLKNEWIDIIIWERADFIDNSFKVIYTEAIPENQSELKKSRELKIKILTYPESLAEIANSKKLITISWTHWKSTTTSLWSLLLKNSGKNMTSVVGTLLKEFNNKNYFHRNNNIKTDPDFFIIEACEYKRSFLKYHPDIAIITNIEIDHLDYYKDLDDYILAYRQLVDNVKRGWYVILNWEEVNSLSLIWIRQDIEYITIHNDYFKYKWQIIYFPAIELKIPWQHIIYDAKLVYILWYLLKIDEKIILDTYKNYNWVWRRMENIWLTINWNRLVSDYWHHPTEIKLTLEAIKTANKNCQLLTIFQPHQYNRTLELLDDFIDSFTNTDKLIVPNIYESRDNEEDKKKINSEIFISKINHNNKIDWKWFENTLRLIEEFDSQNKNAIIILMWAWDIDNLRYKIKTT